jgi:hypothetical protein
MNRKVFFSGVVMSSKLFFFASSPIEDEKSENFSQVEKLKKKSSRAAVIEKTNI